jgi:hypothetical protein
MGKPGVFSFSKTSLKAEVKCEFQNRTMYSSRIPHIGEKRHLGKGPFLTHGEPPIILQKKKNQRNDRKSLNIADCNGVTPVYQHGGLGYR